MCMFLAFKFWRSYCIIKIALVSTATIHPIITIHNCAWLRLDPVKNNVLYKGLLKILIAYTVEEVYKIAKLY